NVVIDSKVPLNSFVNFYNASDEQEKENCRTEFISTIEAVIKGLGEKAYENIDELNSPDFVLLFIPLEGAFSLIYNEFSPIIQSAWDKKIIIVSPSTLLAALRTIRAFWREESQAKNVKEIADESGKLYDKFVLLLNDLLQIRKEFNKTSDLFDGACNKIKDGSGNLIRRVEKIKKLGAKTTKQIPAGFSEEEEEEEVEKIEEAVTN
ncbi:MAG: DNA recombination protein RmuC, partial [Candidatus Aenigmarchaeota archaeon]|nr:DNA recombination protein RmuC [Candidatus Aenigmarchaeota archaeon]